MTSEHTHKRKNVPLCGHCKYSKDLQNPVRGYQPKAPYKCVNIECYADQEPIFDYFHGYVDKPLEWMPCQSMRARGACGESGRYFKPSLLARLCTFATVKIKLKKS